MTINLDTCYAYKQLRLNSHDYNQLKQYSDKDGFALIVSLYLDSLVQRRKQRFTAQCVNCDWIARNWRHGYNFNNPRVRNCLLNSYARLAYMASDEEAEKIKKSTKPMARYDRCEVHAMVPPII